MEERFLFHKKQTKLLFHHWLLFHQELFAWRQESYCKKVKDFQNIVFLLQAGGQLLSHVDVLPVNVVQNNLFWIEPVPMPLLSHEKIVYVQHQNTQLYATSELNNPAPRKGDRVCLRPVF
jgi:hypothetical protein